MKLCTRSTARWHCPNEHDTKYKWCPPCREAQRLASAKWRDVNYEPRERKRQTPEQRRARVRAWYAANREREQARQRAQAAKDPEKTRVAQREASRRHRAAHLVEERDRIRVLTARRRALKLVTQVADFSLEQLEARLSMYPKCWICKTAEWAHVDHVKPLSRGGAHILANLRPACASCNLSKGSRWPFLT